MGGSPLATGDRLGTRVAAAGNEGRCNAKFCNDLCQWLDRLTEHPGWHHVATSQSEHQIQVETPLSYGVGLPFQRRAFPTPSLSRWLYSPCYHRLFGSRPDTRDYQPLVTASGCPGRAGAHAQCQRHKQHATDVSMAAKWPVFAWSHGRKPRADGAHRSRFRLVSSCRFEHQRLDHECGCVRERRAHAGTGRGLGTIFQ